MTIEVTLERIAVALETIAAGGGAVTAAPTTATDTPATTKAEKPAASGKGKPAGKGKATKESKPAKEEPAETEEAKEPELTLNDVRAALTTLQKAVGADAPKALLSEHGASTLSKLDKGTYGAVIAAAKAAAEEAAE